MAGEDDVAVMLHAEDQGCPPISPTISNPAPSSCPGLSTAHPAPKLPDGCPVAQMRPTDDFGCTLFDFVEVNFCPWLLPTFGQHACTCGNSSCPLPTLLTGLQGRSGGLVGPGLGLSCTHHPGAWPAGDVARVQAGGHTQGAASHRLNRLLLSAGGPGALRAWTGPGLPQG